MHCKLNNHINTVKQCLRQLKIKEKKLYFISSIYKLNHVPGVLFQKVPGILKFHGSRESDCQMFLDFVGMHAPKV